MTTSLLVLADTHVPRRAHDLAPHVWEAVDRADAVVHAGDWVSLEFFDALQSRATVLHGVYGNNDGPELRAVLPEVARWEVEGVRFAAVHETGAAKGRELRADGRFGVGGGVSEGQGIDVLVFGHSHIPWDSVTPGGIRLLNPGSPTDRRRQPRASYLWLEVEPDRIADVRFVYF